MAIQISDSGISASVYVTPTSRYLNSTVLYYSDANRLTFDTYKRQPFVPNEGDKFMVIPIGWEYRPDLVSNKVYGFPDYWWRIMEANGMFDVFDFKAGVNIRVPNANTLR